MRILVVEDDALIGLALHRYLTLHDYAVDRVGTGGEALAALAALATFNYEGLVLDIDLPDICGEKLLKNIRMRGFSMPAVVVSARRSIEDRIKLLDVGADDYLTKPFDLDELEARIRAVIRRVRSPMAVELVIEHGPLKLCPSRRLVEWCGMPTVLTGKEFRLLEAFLARRNQVVSRSQLEETLYSWDDEIGSNTVEVYVHHLRRKFANSIIQTVRGVGYQLGTVEKLTAEARMQMAPSQWVEPNASPSRFGLLTKHAA